MSSVLAALALVLSLLVLCIGNTNYSVGTLGSVLLGADPGVDGAQYAILEVRLPRLVAGVLVGFGFGVAGNTFQTMLRNPLASPDIIGITSGASTVAVFCLLVLNMGPASAGIFSVLGALAVAGLIFGLANIGGYTSAKLILVGLGVQAISKAFVNWLLLKAASYDVPEALRWLNGSLSGVQWEGLASVVPIPFIALAVILLGNSLKALELGEEQAVALGAQPGFIRGMLAVLCVTMVAFGTAVTGPVACVTLLAGPIASRLVGQASSATVAAGIVGVVLVLCADLIGQNFLGTRFPVGVVTGLLGTPYLLYLLVRMGRRVSA